MKNGITAKEARKLSDESEETIEDIYCRIRENAKRNMTNLLYCLQGSTSRYALDKILSYLKEDGFTVEHNSIDYTISVSW